MRSDGVSRTRSGRVWGLRFRHSDDELRVVRVSCTLCVAKLGSLSRGQAARGKACGAFYKSFLYPCSSGAWQSVWAV